MVVAGLEDRRGKRKKDQALRTELDKAQIEIEQLKHFEYLSTFPDGDPAGKALVFLKAGISTFAKKNYRDEPTLKLIVAALTQALILDPVEVDFDELLGGLNPDELSPNQELHPKNGSKPTWVMARLGDGTEVIPMFTSRKEAAKGEKVPLMLYDPKDYFRILTEIDMPAIINPFGEASF